MGVSMQTVLPSHWVYKEESNISLLIFNIGGENTVHTQKVLKKKSFVLPFKMRKRDFFDIIDRYKSQNWHGSC